MSTRRQFVHASAAAILAASIATAIDPIKRPSSQPKLKLSLAAYSFRKSLDLKKPSMTLFDFIDYGAQSQIDGVELTSYYFAETSEEYILKLRKHCEQRKLAVSGVPVGNNFCIRDDEKRRKQIEDVKAWIRRAGMLEAETVRIFAGNLEKGDTLEAAQKRVVDAIKECCEEAAKHKVKLALENHGGITSTPEQLLMLVKGVTSEHFGVNVDTGNFHGKDVYEEVRTIAPYGVCVQVKTEIAPAGGKKQEADLPRMIKILKDANYHGYVVLEYEAAEEPRVAVPRYLKELRRLIG